MYTIMVFIFARPHIIYLTFLFILLVYFEKQLYLGFTSTKKTHFIFNFRKIPEQGNTAEIVLNVLHRNFLGVDEFLGMVSLPLRDFDVYERPKTKWYPLKCKPGQSKNDYRGDLEVRTAFTVKAVDKDSDKLGSTADLSSKNTRGSLISLNKAVGNIGGSLMSLGQKEKKNIKKLASKVSNKVEKVGEKARKSLSSQHRDQTTNNAAALPNKFDMNSTSLSKSSTNPYLKKSLTAFGSKSSGPNHDPGVNSDDDDDEELGDLENTRMEEDDMFRFDALSHRSSGNSINVSENMGVVSNTSTPLNGSFENMGVANLSSVTDNVKKIHSGRGRGLAGGSQSPLVSNSRTLSNTLPRKKSSETYSESPVLDDWEQKLLGKKSVLPYSVPSAKSETLSLHNSSTHSSRSNTLERPNKSNKDSVIATHRLPTHEETPNGQKKKIIPVGSDFEGSPSPEFPSSPAIINRQRNRSRSCVVADSPKIESNHGGETEDKKSKKSLNFHNKWKSSVSFRDKDMSAGNRHRLSSESLNTKSHSRNPSDGSGYSQHGVPPSGTRRVPDGQEKTPSPNGPQRIPHEVWDRFEGKSREDLIEAVVQLQSQLECQGKKQVELEDYLDSLLMKVMAKAPDLLQKDLTMTAASKLTPSIK